MNIDQDRDIGGFKVILLEDLPEYKSTGIRLRHRKTGMDVYHVHNGDPENLFAYVFTTPPEDDSGVAHIVEHAVLAGSKAYPVKDPFLSLMKGSVNTFLNAMTYPDKTVYPAASPLRKDFFNLLSVYSDAVFRPLLRREVFLQEGVRCVLEDDATPDVSGIVYNEMKGALSSFESIVADISFRSLFPDTPYRYESGGDPRAIRDLDYEMFLRFYETCYHPSNCRLFLYGDIPTEELLSFIEPWITDYEPRQNAAGIASQPDWNAPVYIQAEGPGGDDNEEKTSYTINWKLVSLTDPCEVLGLELLSEILLGNQGSPMYKALYESPFGQDLSPSCGIDTDLRDLVFSLGVRGAEAGQEHDFKEFVFAELEKLVFEGIPSDVIEGCITRLEFRNREIRGGVPFGLRLMGRSLRGWLHGLSPSATLSFHDHMAVIKNMYRRNPGFFADYIKRYFLNNQHYTVVTVESTPGYQKKLESEHLAWRKNKGQKLEKEQIAAIREDLDLFNSFQSKIDTPEDIARIPVLSLYDIPAEIKRYECVESTISTVPFFRHQQFTNGIIYTDLAFALPYFDSDEEMLIPFFGKVLNSCGIGSLPYDEVARKWSLLSGGVSSFIETSSDYQNGKPLAFLFFRLKTVPEKHREAILFLLSMLKEACFDDKKRIKDLLLEYRNEMRSTLVSSGHTFSALRAASFYSAAMAREERWKGVDQYRFVHDLAENIDLETERVITRLQNLAAHIICSQGLSLHSCCDVEHESLVRESLKPLVDGLPAGDFCRKASISAFEQRSRNEAFIVPSAVNHLAMVIPAASYLDPEHAAESLVAHLLKTDLLWEKIRMQGGAYGAYASANGGDGFFSFGSFRDPHLVRTYNAFSQSLEELAMDIPDDALEQAKISIMGSEFKPLVPSELSLTGFRRRLYGITDDMRQQKFNRIRSVSIEELATSVRRLKASLKEKAVSVAFGNEEAIRSAKDASGSYFDKIHKLL